nr:phosphatidylglycerophosphatase A [Roseateles sp.]
MVGWTTRATRRGHYSSRRRRPSRRWCGVHEIVAFWLILWLVSPVGFWGQLIAFALFRYFDAAKPGPVGWADRLFKGERGQPVGWAQGWGILFDDFVAAGCTLMVIALWRAILG